MTNTSPGAICDDHDKHTTYYPYCIVTYWKGGHAALPTDEWTQVRISPLGIYKYNDFSFEPTEKSYNDAYRFLQFLEQAWLCGKADAKLEIRKVLGIKEPR